MINPIDALVLAHTKLKTRKIRTGIAIGVAGLLFGVLVFIILVSQGVFASVERFSSEGINDRYIVSISSNSGMRFDAYEHLQDAVFVHEVESVHATRIALKQSMARKYGIDYDAKRDDPSPVIKNSDNEKVIDESFINSPDVEKVVKQRTAEIPGFDIKQFLKDQKTVKMIQKDQTLFDDEIGSSFEYMPGGKEAKEDGRRDDMSAQSYFENRPKTLQVIDQSLAKEFITSSYNPADAEVPVILTYSDAEKILGLKKLDQKSSSEQKLARLDEVRRRVGEATVSFCYRNQASVGLLSTAKEQQAEIKKNEKNKDYIKPALVYNLPDETSCGPVTIREDRRTSSDKNYETKIKEFQEAIGEPVEDPSQYKLTLRGVGISGDSDYMAPTFTVGGLVTNLLTSNLGYGAWTVPAGLLEQMPADSPAKLLITRLSSHEYEVGQYLVEFGSRDEVKALMSRYQDGNKGAFVGPYGNNVLIFDEIKAGLNVVMKWLFIVVGVVAAIILAGIIGRTVSDGRRESAVFRAIGANRFDIAGIYGTYTLLLCLRVIAFAFVLGGVAALLLDFFYTREATVAARLAYAASDTAKEFHLFSLGSVYLLIVMGVILGAGILSSIVPILMGAKRSPIKDMRNDNT